MKRLLQRCLPDPHYWRTHKNLRFLGESLHDPRLWHFNRRSTVRGLAAGAFYAFVPFPWQMLLAAITAAWLRFNLPVAVAMVWITNPLTIPPIAFVNYRFGAWLLAVRRETGPSIRRWTGCWKKRAISVCRCWWVRWRRRCWPESPRSGSPICSGAGI